MCCMERMELLIRVDVAEEAGCMKCVGKVTETLRQLPWRDAIKQTQLTDVEIAAESKVC